MRTWLCRDVLLVVLLIVVVVDMVSKRVGGEDAERVRARDGEREGRLLGGRKLLKVLRPAPPHLQTRLLKTRSSLKKSHLSWTPLHTGQLPRSLSNRSWSRVELVKVLNDISPQGHQLQLCQGKLSPQGDIWILLVHFLGQLNKAPW